MSSEATRCTPGIATWAGSPLAEMTAPGYVVLLDAYDPGWRVTVDGRPARLLRANLLFRAVAVPPGRHTVEMVYRPAALVVGLLSTALTAAICAVVLVGPRISGLRARGPSAAMIRATRS